MRSGKTHAAPGVGDGDGPAEALALGVGVPVAVPVGAGVAVAVGVLVEADVTHAPARHESPTAQQTPSQKTCPVVLAGPHSTNGPVPCAA